MSTAELARSSQIPPVAEAHAAKLVSVVDCGTVSVRCTIAEIRAGSDGEAEWRILEDAEHPLELQNALRNGRFSLADMESVVAACGATVRLGRSYGVARTQAVASAALREVVNCDVLFERVKHTVGLDVDLIDGAEEGRLYHQALKWVLQEEGRNLNGSVLLMDIGRSSSSVSHVLDGSLVQTQEEHVGTDRMAYGLTRQQDSEDLPYCLDRLSLGATQVMMSRLRLAVDGAAFDSVLVTGRGPRAVRRFLSPKPEGLLPELTRDQLDEAFAEGSRLRPDQRGAWAGGGASKFTFMMSSLALMRRVVHAAGVERVIVPELQLRLGLFFDLLPDAPGMYRLPREQLIAAAEQLAVRYGMDLAYSRNTAALACQLFDATQSLHGLSPRDRLLLELAALVHDVGAYVNVRSRHKHSYYIIKYAEISGLSHTERERLALLARYHRGKAPQRGQPEFSVLNRSERAVVGYLAALLRLAYALDVERVQRISKVQCYVDGNEFKIRVDQENVAVERWSMTRKSELFRRIFGLNVTVLPRLSSSIL